MTDKPSQPDPAATDVEPAHEISHAPDVRVHVDHGDEPGTFVVSVRRGDEELERHELTHETFHQLGESEHVGVEAAPPPAAALEGDTDDVDETPAPVPELQLATEISHPEDVRVRIDEGDEPGSYIVSVRRGDETLESHSVTHETFHTLGDSELIETAVRHAPLAAPEPEPEPEPKPKPEPEPKPKPEPEPKPKPEPEPEPEPKPEPKPKPEPEPKPKPEPEPEPEPKPEPKPEPEPEPEQPAGPVDRIIAIVKSVLDRIRGR